MIAYMYEKQLSLLALRRWCCFTRWGICASISDRNSILMIWNLSRILPGAIDYKWQSKDKWSNVNALNLLQNSQYSWNIHTLLKKNHLSFVEACFRRTQNLSTIDQEKQKIQQIYIWNPFNHCQFNYVNIDFTS